MRRVDVVRDDQPDHMVIRNAAVTATGQGVASISLDSVTVADVPHMGNMAPQVGHTVKVLVTNRSMLIIGSLNPDAYTAGGGGGTAPPAQDPLATQVTRGTPGTFGPPQHRDPATQLELQTINGGSAWSQGQYVTVAGADYYWDGSQWQAGRVPAPPTQHVVQGVWQAVPEHINPQRPGELQFLTGEIRLNPTDDNGQDPDFSQVQVGDTLRIQQARYDDFVKINRIYVTSTRIFIEIPVLQPRPTMNHTETTITIDH